MKGLKIIPMFAGLLLLSYVGVLFVRNNPDEVIVRFGTAQSPSSALGFVILTSVLVGMIIAGILCSAELLMLYVQNQRLKRRLSGTSPPEPQSLLDSALNSDWEEQELEAYEEEEEKAPENPKEEKKSSEESKESPRKSPAASP